ncbi:MAG: LptF/LptG family permease [Caulobacterales bacterium]|nr:LptF/LptG family permease [Caulobacterales bacterium]
MLQRYILRQALWPLIAAVSSLGVLALLTQSVSTLDLIIDQRQTLGVYLKITGLALPQLIAYILPLALLIATFYSMNRLQSDSELVVCKAAGVSRWRLASPLVKLGIAAMVVNLTINLWVQPTSFRAMRALLYEVRADLAAKLVRPGQFHNPAEGLTIYARDIEPGGRVVDLLIEDATNAAQPVTYMAKAGVFTDVSGEVALVMYEGSAQSLSEDRTLSFLDFDSYTFVLSTIIHTPESLFYKLSDLYLHELLFPDPYQLWTWRYHAEVLAEGHFRLTAPLYNPAFVLIALAAILGGEYSRTGYFRRIAIAAAAALIVRVLGFAAQSASADNVAFNLLQYAIPLATAGGALWIILSPRVHRARSPARPTATGALAEARA